MKETMTTKFRTLIILFCAAVVAINNAHAQDKPKTATLIPVKPDVTVTPSDSTA